jgi:catechol 2,3-dioxygenase-like lactoylglutathione lyase family enzyme
MSAVPAFRPGKDQSPARFLKVTPRLPVADLARTIAFYTEMLRFQAGPPSADEPTFVVLEQDDMSLQFYTGERPGAEPTGHGTIYFDVSDVRAMHRALAGRLPIEWGPEVYWYGRREFAVRDPDGYLLIFSEKTSDPPTCGPD